MNTEIKSSKGDLAEANSQLSGMWEEVVRRYNIHDELVQVCKDVYDWMQNYSYNLSPLHITMENLLKAIIEKADKEMV